MSGKLYLLMGYPGSGKTTASKLIAEATGAIHLWADHIRREQNDQPTYSPRENRTLYNNLNKKTGELLSQGQSVIFDTNFNFYRDRQNLRKIAATYGAACELIWVQTPKDIAQNRAVHNSHMHDTRILGAMPPDQFKRLTKNLQFPKEDEPAIILDGTKLSKEYVIQKLGL